MIRSRNVIFKNEESITIKSRKVVEEAENIGEQFQPKSVSNSSINPIEQQKKNSAVTVEANEDSASTLNVFWTSDLILVETVSKEQPASEVVEVQSQAERSVDEEGFSPEVFVTPAEEKRRYPIKERKRVSFDDYEIGAEMENSKCIISPNTHRPVVNSAGNVIIENNKLILFNVPGNTIVRVPITNGLEQMFKITPRPILASCEEAARPSVTVEEDAESCSENLDSQSDLQCVEQNVIELLIEEIAKRPPLYNEKLPLIQRSKSIRKALEMEVYHALGGQIPIDDINKKWCYLKKEYKKHRAVLHKYIKSGCSFEEAAEITGKPLWKHYKMLSFIDDPLDDRATVSNIVNHDNEVNGSSSSSTVQTLTVSNYSRSDETPATNPSRKRKAEPELSKVDQLIVAELTKPQEKLGSSDHFCQMLALEMKKLEARKRAVLQIKFLQLLQEQLYE
ncbi:hypothetical protein RN001_014559 [Aquatica leii]|uniref:MADF domain-containing protein n=1 Tax=Aquatica leii TaxID=1421715 RepID=A0AAN7NUN7_9COLE|nr:hypothetical protein RN001_014559 [Aquatica leii]